MKINKLIKSKMEREYLFIQGNIPIDSKYFIKEIEEGIKKDNNLNYNTNLLSKMTSFEYFRNNRKFLKTLLPIFDLVDKEDLKAPSWFIKDAWGFKQGMGDYSRIHDHNPHQVFLSGSIMLNNHSQSLHFPEINSTLEAKPGNFSVFSSFLKHYNNRNSTDKDRYGLSFNLYYVDEPFYRR